MSESTASGTKKVWYRRWWAILLVIPGIVLAVIALLAFFFVSAAVPLPEDVGASPSTVYDVNGDKIGTLNAQEARQDIPVGDLPEYVPQAVMAAEDRAFFEHSGISPTGVVRALFTNAAAGEIRQGGSTITQQYVKNALVGNERTFTRKAKEAALAIKLEQRFEKQKILEMYLNTIYWGRGAYGVEAAAKTYFDKPATELTVNEIATLAGIIQAPESLDPNENPQGAEERRRYVLDGMLDEGWIEQAAHSEAVDAGLPEVTDRTSVEYGMGAYYLDAVRRELAAEIGEEEIFRGLEIHTAMDTSMQQAAEETLEGTLDGAPYTGAIVSVDPRSGGVRALVGGPDFADQQFNTAVRAARQVGSSFKAFTLAGFVTEGYSPESRFEGPACIDVEDSSQEGGQGEICNYDQSDHGTVDLYEGTAGSINTVYAQVQQAAGSTHVIETAVTSGLPEERDGGSIMEPFPALTLGVDEFTPLEMASAYGTFAAAGVHIQPHLVVEVVDSQGEVVYEADVEQREAIPANDAAIVTDVLRGVITGGTGTAADIGRPAAGKTGTTNDYTNAWFVGYVPQLATSVWIGNLEGSTPLEGDITGGSVPAETWGAYMAKAVEGLPVEEFPSPDLSDKQTLNEEPTESPSPTPSPTPSPEPSGPTECPDDGSVTEIILPSGDKSPCPQETSEPEEEPSPTETQTGEPTPSESDTILPDPDGDG